MAVMRNAVMNSMKFEDGPDGLVIVKLANGEVYGSMNERGEFVPSEEFAPAKAEPEASDELVKSPLEPDPVTMGAGGPAARGAGGRFERSSETSET